MSVAAATWAHGRFFPGVADPMSSIDEARRRAGRQPLRDGETETELQITKHIIFAADRPVDWLTFSRWCASVVGISNYKDFPPTTRVRCGM